MNPGLSFNNNGANNWDDLVDRIKQIINKILFGGCLSQMLFYAVVILITIIFFISPMLFYDNFVNEVKEKVGDAVEEVEKTAERFWNFVTFNGWQTNEESFYSTLESQSEKYLEKGVRVDTRIVMSILFYDEGADVEVSGDGETFGCSISSEDEDADYTSCDTNTGNGNHDYKAMRDDVKELIDGQVDENGLLKSEDDYKQWLKDNYVEDKLDDLGYDIPTEEAAKDRLFNQFITEVYEKKELYEELIGEEGATCEVTSLGPTVTEDQLKSTNYTQCLALIGPAATAAFQKTHIYASVTLAQAIIESGCGKHTPQNSNNLFGIKCSKTQFSLSTWDGSCTTPVTTSEQTTSGASYSIKASFRKYQSVNEAILDHAALLAQGNTYQKHKVAEAATPEEQAKRLKSAGYATDVSYSSKIIKTIEKYDLTKYDTMSGGTEGSSTSCVGQVNIGEIDVDLKNKTKLLQGTTISDVFGGPAGINELNALIKSNADKYSSNRGNAAAAAAITLINALGQKGYTLPYYWGGGHSGWQDVAPLTTGVYPKWGAKVRASSGYNYSSLDCSGFVSWAIRNGACPSYTAQGSTNFKTFGKSISKNEAKPGDLLWWSGHIQLVVQNNNGDVTLAASGGSGVTYYKFNESWANKNKPGWTFIDMASYYNSSSCK